MEKCILIYDDDMGILAVTKIILERKKYRVETRTWCDDIINEVTAINPDLVFMDLWIPMTGGESALKLMKQNEATRQVPLYFFPPTT